MLSETRFTAIVNLPITEYQPDQLLIIVSLSPNETAPVVADFPASYQYTVMFSGLKAGTSYITVRILFDSDMTDVVEGSFTIVSCYVYSFVVIAIKANKGALKEYFISSLQLNTLLLSVRYCMYTTEHVASPPTIIIRSNP